MHVLDVIPIGKNIGKETLSYFSNKTVTLGSCVEIPVKNKIVRGIVVAIHDAIKLKAYLKSSEYALRNIHDVLPQSPFSEDFLKTCIRIKNYSVCSTGSIISAMVSEHIFNISYEHFEKTNSDIQHSESALIPERFFFQAPLDERIDYYKTYIRQEFARKKSVCFIAPTQAYADFIAERIGIGIKERTIVCHSGLSTKKINAAMMHILEHDQPVVAIITPTFLSLITEQKFSTCITEFEGSEYYRRQERPLIDMRMFIMTYVHILGLHYIIADDLIRTETILQLASWYYQPLRTHYTKIASPLKIETTFPEKDEFDLSEYPLLSKKFLNFLKEHSDKKILIFAPRKGLAPVSLCQDCGTVVTDPNDHTTPLVLHESGSGKTLKRYYQNPKTLARIPVMDTCHHCSSWRIKNFGISTQSIQKYLLQTFPLSQDRIFVMDGIVTNSPQKIKKVLTEWDSGGILITTEKSFPYLLDQKIHTTYIASLEPLLMSPAYSSHERILRILMFLLGRTEHHFFIQIKNNDQEIIHIMHQKNLSDWYQSEENLRRDFLYPPFGHLIKIETYGSASAIKKREDEIQQLLRDYDYRHVIYKLGSNYHMNITLRCTKEDWYHPLSPDQKPAFYAKLFRLLESLPESYTVVMNHPLFL